MQPVPASLRAVATLVLLAALSLRPAPARAHCDTLDGPVVAAARQALAAGDLTPVLMWVQPADEAEIRAAFQRALGVRKLQGEAQALADTWFFETLVRVHRAGEGAPYTGLKSAGSELGPAIPAADQALKTGDAAPLLRLLTEAMREGVHARFEQARARHDFAPADVAAGRAYVEAYVPFIHFVERLYVDATTSVEHHVAEPTGSPQHESPAPHH